MIPLEDDVVFLDPNTKGDIFNLCQRYVLRRESIPLDLIIASDNPIDQSLKGYARFFEGMRAPTSIKEQNRWRSFFRQGEILDLLIEQCNEYLSIPTGNNLSLRRRTISYVVQDPVYPWRTQEEKRKLQEREEQGIIVIVEPITYISDGHGQVKISSPLGGWYEGSGVVHLSMESALKIQDTTLTHEIAHGILGLGHHISGYRACVMHAHWENGLNEQGNILDKKPLPKAKEVVEWKTKAGINKGSNIFCEECQEKFSALIE